MKHYLIADIGGTNSNFALLEIKDNKSKIIFKKSYLTSSYLDFIDIVNEFLNLCVQNYRVLIKNAVFAVAGKIEKNKVKLSHNCSKIFDIKLLIKKSSLKNIKLINDFTAIAYSINNIQSSNLKVLNKGKIQKTKPILLIGAGTGLGKSTLYYNFPLKSYLPKESEAGHSDISINSKQELELIQFIKKKIKLNFVSWENILSGSGIELIYQFLSKKKLSANQISKNKKQDKFAKQTFEIFYKFYARFSKNSAIDNLAQGGIYLAGGIIEKNLIFSKKDFMQEFTNNKLFEDMLKNIPIHIIKNYDISLTGLENYVLKELENE